MKITVIDYGLSNLLSVRRAFEYFGAEVEVTGSRSRILSAKALVLPGVGAFKDGMAGLSGLSLADAIADKCAVARRFWASAWACRCSSMKVMSSDVTGGWD